MNFLNRLIIVVLLLVGLVAACGSFFVVLFARASVANAIEPSLTALSTSSSPLPQLFCLGIALLVVVFSILLLYLELMPSGKTRMHLKSIQGADVLISADAITTQLQYALDPLAGVLKATPKVAKGKGDAVDVMVDISTTSDIDVKRKTDEVMDVTRSVVEGGLGLRVGKVQIKIDQMKPPKRGSPPPMLDLPKLVTAKVEDSSTPPPHS